MGHDRNNGHNTKMEVDIQPNIGLDDTTSQAVVKTLNITLADEAVLTQKTRSAHWNVQGAGFYDRHTLFDAQYKQLNDIFDDISKRVRMVGGQPIGSFEEFLNHARLNEQPEEVPDMLDLLADHETFIRFLREDAKKCSEVYEDEGTRDFLVGVLCLHERLAWMLRSYVEPKLIGDESFKTFMPKKGTTPIGDEVVRKKIKSIQR